MTIGDPVPEWVRVWDESYIHDGYEYGDVDEYNFMEMGMGCPNPMWNSPLTPLAGSVRTRMDDNTDSHPSLLWQKTFHTRIPTNVCEGHFLFISVLHRDKSPTRSLFLLKLQLGCISFIINTKHHHLYTLLDLRDGRLGLNSGSRRWGSVEWFSQSFDQVLWPNLDFHPRMW
jgi:hypothetical protein